MKTRLARGNSLGGAGSGMSMLAQALAGGDRSEQAAFQNASIGQSKIAQAMAAARASDASVGNYQAQAAEHQAKADVLGRRPGLYEEQAAIGSGVDVPTIQSYRQKLATGIGRPVPMGPDAEDGSMGVGSEQFSPEVSSKIGQALQRLVPLMASSGDIKADDWAKASGMYQDQDQEAQVAAGTISPIALALQRNAAKGAPVYHFDQTGAVGNNFTGALDTSSPLAGATIDRRTQQGAQAKAGAAENYAQGRAADAMAGLRTVQAGAVGNGPGRVPVGYRYTADPDTGETRLEPIPGGPKDPSAQTGKPLPAAAAKALLENSTNLRRAQTALSLAQGEKVGELAGDPSATGWKGMLPNQLLNRWDPQGVPTRAAIADLGSLVIHDRSGAAVTASEYPRLAPFVPSATDDAKTVKSKLSQFVKNYQEVVNESVDFHKASGYNVPADSLHKAPVSGGNGGRAVQRTGTVNGRKVIQYTDGTTEYAD